MLFITHDLRVAAQICDYVAVMSKGRVVEYGSAEQVFGAPRDDYTKALFAAAPGQGLGIRPLPPGLSDPTGPVRRSAGGRQVRGPAKVVARSGHPL